MVLSRKLEQYVQKVKWTKMDSMEIYRDLVASAKRIAGPKLSIAEWKLETYGLRTE